MKRIKKNPKDKFERELWELWDAMKRAMDKQEDLRGTDGFWQWMAEAARYWNFLNTWESLVCGQHPDRVSRAYADWTRARGLGNWEASFSGPLWWGTPFAVAGDAGAWQDWGEAQKAKRQAVDQRLKKWLERGIKKHRDAKRKADDRVHAQAGE